MIYLVFDSNELLSWVKMSKVFHVLNKAGDMKDNITVVKRQKLQQNERTDDIVIFCCNIADDTEYRKYFKRILTISDFQKYNYSDYRLEKIIKLDDLFEFLFTERGYKGQYILRPEL